MSKIIWKPVCLLLALALVFSLAAAVLTFGGSSVVTAQGDDMVCQTSSLNCTGRGANTTHNFTVPVGAEGGYVLVEFRGDFGEWSANWSWENDEFIVVYIEGDYVGRAHSDLDDCDGNWTAAMWTLGAAQMPYLASDGMISVMVQNSEEVNGGGCEYNQHRVTLCYTMAPVTCEESLVSYNGSGANTTHNFSVPPGATSGYVTVLYRGDFGRWSESWNWTDDEFIVVYIEGDYVGRAHSDLDDCDGNWTAAMWTLGAAQMSGWAADGMISVMVVNSPEVDDFCPREDGTYNQHWVILCYTTTPPVGGEAYPVSKASLLAPWIAAGIVVAAGIIWYVLRRRKAQS